RQNGADSGADLGWVLIDLPVGEAHHPVSFGLQPPLSLGVAKGHVRPLVDPAVNFHDQPSSMANEIYYIRAYRRLMAEPEGEAAKMLPQARLRMGRFRPHSPGAICSTGSDPLALPITFPLEGGGLGG